MSENEPVFGILLSELNEWERENLCWSEVQDLQQRIRARGPVAQRAPAAPRYFPIRTCNGCPNQIEMHHLYKPYGTMSLPPGKEPTDFMGRWACTGKEDRETIDDRIPNWCPLPQDIPSKEHDAALIAKAIAEDRKLRPRPPCEECNWQERLEKEKIKAWEDVLKEAIDRTVWLDGHGIDEGKSLVALGDVQKMLDTLRSEVGK